MKPRHIELLAALGRERHLGRAAQALHITQPAASKTLAQLEQVLGCVLFIRTPRGMTPTPVGDVLIAHARHISGSSERIAAELESLQLRQRQSLHIGALPSASVSVVPELIEHMLAHDPMLEITVYEAVLPVLIEDLHKGTLDVVIGRMENRRPDDTLEEIFMYEEPITIVCRSAHPLAAQSQMSTADLERSEWLLPLEGTLLRSRLNTLFQQLRINPPAAKVVSNALLTNIRLVRSNDWLAALPKAIAQYYLVRGELCILPVEHDMNFGDVGALISRHRPQIPIVEKAIAWLRSYVPRSHRD